MQNKRLQKSLNRAIDQQMALLVHDACATVETEPTETDKRLNQRLTHVMQVEQIIKEILKL